MHARKPVLLPLIALLGLPAAVASPPPVARPAPAPTVGASAPDFALRDLSGKPHTLTEFRGRPAALFFFCGCPWCWDCAAAWGRLQRQDALPAASATVVVFSGDAAEGQAFQASTGLDPARTVFLCDPTDHAARLYRVNPCPRAFVLTGEHRIAYTNSRPDDAPRQAPADRITARALTALRTTSVPARQ